MIKIHQNKYLISKNLVSKLVLHEKKSIKKNEKNHENTVI